MTTKIFTAGPESVLGRHLTYVLIERELLENETQSPPRQPQLTSAEDRAEPTEKVFALCEKTNAGSSKVLSKCGFRVIGQEVYDEDEVLLWELKKPVLRHSCP